MLIDTHSHIYEPEFDADRDAAVERAREAGVGLLLFPAMDSESDRRLFDCCRRYGDFVRPMMGLHPTSVNDNALWREELSRVERYLQSPPEGVERFFAIGEIGLDLYWSDRFKREQCEAFEAQLELSLKYGLPVAIHTRNAWREMQEVMQSFRGRGLCGVFHAFSESAECYREMRRCGDFVFGIGGTVTFKKSATAECVREMNLDEIVLETDCPYLTPVPHRGERNESAYIRFVCEKVAEIKGITAEQVADQTTATARRIFRL